MFQEDSPRKCVYWDSEGKCVKHRCTSNVKFYADWHPLWAKTTKNEQQTTFSRFAKKYFSPTPVEKIPLLAISTIPRRRKLRSQNMTLHFLVVLNTLNVTITTYTPCIIFRHEVVDRGGGNTKRNRLHGLLLFQPLVVLFYSSRKSSSLKQFVFWCSNYFPRQRASTRSHA